MCRFHGVTVVLGIVTAVAGFGCGGGDARRTARVPSASAAREPTSTTSAALTTSTTTTTSAPIGQTSSSMQPGGQGPYMNASMAQVATPPVSLSSSVIRITTAVCDREAACNRVGTGRAYGDREECVNSVGHDVVGVLKTDDCPAGTDADRLSACLSEVQAKACEGEGGVAVDGIAACNREQLCARSY